MIQFRVIYPHFPNFPFSQNLVDLNWVFLHTCPEVQIDFPVRVTLHRIAHIIGQLHDLDPTILILTSKWTLIWGFPIKNGK